jgi:hypothetical protein
VLDREQWRPFLKRWSEEWIAAHENDRPLDDLTVRDGWLGFAPASADEIAAAAARLGCSLPPSLRSFLEPWEAILKRYRLAVTRGTRRRGAGSR